MLSFLPQIEFSNTELVILSQKLADPLVKKYFTMLAAAEAQDLLMHGDAKDGETAEELLRRQAIVRGRISVMETLLTISEHKEPVEGNGNSAG